MRKKTDYDNSNTTNGARFSTRRSTSTSAGTNTSTSTSTGSDTKT